MEGVSDRPLGGDVRLADSGRQSLNEDGGDWGALPRG